MQIEGHNKLHFSPHQCKLNTGMFTAVQCEVLTTELMLTVDLVASPLRLSSVSPCWSHSGPVTGSCEASPL